MTKHSTEPVKHNKGDRDIASRGHSTVTFTLPIEMFQKILNGTWRTRGGLRLACELISQSPYNQENGTAGDAMSIHPGKKVVYQTLGCF